MRTNKNNPNFPEVHIKPKRLFKEGSGLVTFVHKGTGIQIGEAKVYIKRSTENGTELVIQAPLEIKISKID